MKISLRITSLSFKLLGRVLLFFSIIFIYLFFYYINTVLWLVIGIIFLILGLLIKNKKDYIIFRSSDFVIKKIKEVLNLLNLEISQNKNTITINKTKTIVKVNKLLGLVFLHIIFNNRNSSKENYIAKTLVKFQIHH